VASISLEAIRKTFDNGVLAVDDLNLQIADGEFAVMLGPSGCGKTTALRIIAGLEDPEHGTVRIGDEVVNGVASKDRNIAMVFQNYALYPQMTVRQNMSFSLRLHRVPKPEMRTRVESAAALLGLEHLLERRPRTLSGGQRQRVAMGRAIVRDPAVFLMDEPLSNLDAKLRIQMRAELVKLHQRLGTTIVYVTHDQTEAMTMGETVAVMSSGKLVQLDTPQRLYREPESVFVATFVGSPPMNIVSASASVADGIIRLEFGEHVLTIPAESNESIAMRCPCRFGLGFRPDDIDVDRGHSSATSTIAVRAEVVELLGSDALVHFSLGSGVQRFTEAMEEARETAALEGAVFTARVRDEAAPRTGDLMHLHIPPERLHFFDESTGLRVQRTARREAEEILRAS
jgi:multiple sugar transport system ATP-binding protein